MTNNIETKNTNNPKIQETFLFLKGVFLWHQPHLLLPNRNE